MVVEHFGEIWDKSKTKMWTQRENEERRARSPRILKLWNTVDRKLCRDRVNESVQLFVKKSRNSGFVCGDLMWGKAVCGKCESACARVNVETSNDMSNKCG